MSKLESFILQLASEKDRVKTREVVASYGKKISRQYVSFIIKKLVREGRLFKSGSRKDAFYVAAGKDLSFYEKLSKVTLKLKNENLEEHIILSDITQKALFFDSLKENLKSIFNYTFSEMLNNAIEHSSSKNIEIEVSKNESGLNFIVNDFGVGVFRNIMQKKNLRSELEAIQDLLKGKTTTQPQAHSGEGIFFTSKLADVFTLESFEYKLTIDNEIPDVFIGKMDKLKKGTRVTFSIGLNSKRHAVDVFKNYQTNQDTMAFDKTDVKIKLYTMGTVHISRSQARRVLSGLEKFKLVILDFDKVPMIGQGFADEIFRVFNIKHPETIIQPINMNDAVEFMIRRVEKPR
jgi:hypothetical protein